MFNKVFLPNPRYSRLRAASALLFLAAVVIAALMIFVGVLNGRNYNGEVAEVAGTVTFAGEARDSFLIELDGSERYTISPIRDAYDGWETLLGKQVALTLPQRQIGSAYRWVVGVRQGDDVLVDWHEKLASGRANCQTALIVMGVVLGVTVLASGGSYALQKKTPATVERDLAPSYCDFIAQRQPCCPLYRKLPLITAGLFALVIVMSLILGLVGELVSNTAVRISVGAVALAIFAAAIALYAVAVCVWLPKKEREFYAAHYPFDFNDISHVTLSKKFKEQLQKELKEEAEAYPHRYGEGGNSLLCDFNEKGVSLSLEVNPEEKPSADDVFGEGGEEIAHLCDLTYDELNFEAVPHYRKRDRSLFIVVKSRLQPTEKLEEIGICNDLHIMLDSNLLATLRHFGVQVENLDYLLQNKAQLMAEHCPHSKRGA